MTKKELIRVVKERGGLDSLKTAEKAINAFIDVVKDELKKGEQVAILGFGTFRISERGERKIKSPVTKKEITIKARKLPVFKASSNFKDYVNG